MSTGRPHPLIGMIALPLSAAFRMAAAHVICGSVERVDVAERRVVGEDRRYLGRLSAEPERLWRAAATGAARRRPPVSRHTGPGPASTSALTREPGGHCRSTAGGGEGKSRRPVPLSPGRTRCPLCRASSGTTRFLRRPAEAGTGWRPAPRAGPPRRSAWRGVPRPRVRRRRVRRGAPGS